MSDNKAAVDALFTAANTLSAITSELTFLTESISNSIDTWDSTAANGACFLLYRIRDDVEAQYAAIWGAMKALNPRVSAPPKETDSQVQPVPA